MPNDEFFEINLPWPRGAISFGFMSRNGLDFIANEVRASGLANYERPTPGLIVSLSQGGRGAVLDIGANTGIFSLLPVAANPEVEVFAFEPLAPLRDILGANLSLNPALAERVHVEPFALSDQSGEMAFFETINSFGFLTTSSSLELSHAQSIDNGQFRDGRVQCLTLDSWAENRIGDLPIRLLKIDVERHEHAVIAGGRGTIARHRPMIILEVLAGSELEPIRRMIAEEQYLDFAITPLSLRQSFHTHYVGGSTNHLLCPVEKVEEIFRLARQHNLAIEVG